MALSPVAQGAAITPPADSLGKFLVKSEAITRDYLWLNLTWAGNAGGIVFDGTPSSQAEGSAANADPVLEAQLSAGDASWTYTHENIAPLLPNEVFTSPALDRDLHLNNSRHIQVDLLTKAVGDVTKPCNSPNAQAVPRLNVYLTMGNERIGTSIVTGYMSSTTTAGPAGWGLCRHRVAPEVHTIPKGSVLKLTVEHIKQDAVYPFGFSGDFRSVVRIPLFPVEEVLYRHPEFLAPAETDPAGTAGDGSGTGTTFMAAGLALAGTRRGARRTLLLAAVLVGAAMAGCLKSEGNGPAPKGGVDTDDGKITNTHVQITDPGIVPEPGKGSIYGLVHDDLHLPVGNVHVSVIGHTEFTTTDSKGKFNFANLPAGKHKLRFDKEEYRSFEAEVEVKANFVTSSTIELQLVNPKSRDARPHVHNGWLTIPEGKKTLMDVDLDMRCNDQNRCTTFSDFLLPAKGEENNAIMPGTQDVRVTLSWTEPKVGAKLGLAVQPNNEVSTHSLFEPRASGKPFLIPVSWEKDDPGHQLVSTWKFAFYRAPPDYPNAAEAKQEETTPNGGRVHAKVEILRGGALPLEPAHPDHWKGLATYQVMKDRSDIMSPCDAAKVGHCDFSLEFVPDSTKIVPPATKRLEVEFVPDKASTTGNPWDLYVETGAMQYTDPGERGLGQYQKVQRSASSTAEKVKWTLAVKTHEVDGEYAKKSGWTFVVYPEDVTLAQVDILPSMANQKTSPYPSGKLTIVAHQT